MVVGGKVGFVSWLLFSCIDHRSSVRMFVVAIRLHSFLVGQKCRCPRNSNGKRDVQIIMWGVEGGIMSGVGIEPVRFSVLLLIVLFSLSPSV